MNIHTGVCKYKYKYWINTGTLTSTYPQTNIATYGLNQLTMKSQFCLGFVKKKIKQIGLENQQKILSCWSPQNSTFYGFNIDYRFAVQQLVNKTIVQT